MSDKPIATISSTTLKRWLLLGLPAVTLWVIGGLGALSLLGGLADGSVTPGTGSTASGLGMMWALIVFCSIVGVLIGMKSLFRLVPYRVLGINAMIGLISLFFSVLT